MNEEESSVDPKKAATHDTYGESLLYDFSKFLITLSLLVLGGMLTLSKSAQQGDVKIGNIIMVAASLGAAALIAFATANGVVYARARGREPPSSLPKLLKAATLVLIFGIGGFLMLWINTLS